MNNIQEAWFKYNEYTNQLTYMLGGTSGIVGEYAEYLTHQHYGGTRLQASSKGVDIEGMDGKKYQVKSRKINDIPTTQLGIIRSWGFDYLIVIIFDLTGRVRKALEISASVAREFAKSNKHQNGYVITTTAAFLNDPRGKDITNTMRAIQLDSSTTDLPKLADAAESSVHKIPASTMQKMQALKLVSLPPQKGIHFSNINMAVPIWWLDIPVHEIDSQKLGHLTFVLFNRHKRLLHVLHIPTSFLRQNSHKLVLFRKKTGDFYSFKISPKDSSIFMNNGPNDSKIDFSEFLNRSVLVQ